jgi:DDE superfamily endonuclease
MSRSSNRSLAVGHCPGIRSNGLRSSWPSPRGSRSDRSPSAPNAIRRRSGGSAAATRPRACPTSCDRPNGPGDRPGFPPLQRAQIVRLACLEPIAKGLHITHWTSQDLARQAVEDGIVPAISARTIQAILDRADLQPHRTRYWRTSRVDVRFKERAEKILWCYAHAERLARRGIWVVCADEKPNFQVLERHPTRQSVPGSIGQREFDYTRHGTVNILVFLIVHSGRMEAACFDSKSAGRYVQELEAFRNRHRQLRGIYLIHDNDPTHTAAKTRDYLAGCSGWWRSRFSPVRASWLDQAELLLGAFGYHYLKRGSWRSRAEFIDYVGRAWPEYNRLYAHPFEWTWSSQKMRKWVEKHGL